jgi:hypothetical protein
MLYAGSIIRDNLQVDESLQLPPHEMPQYVDTKYLDLEGRIVRDMEEVADVLPLLSNHILLESMVMKNMAPLQDNPFNRLIPAAYLYSFIRHNQGPIGNSFNTTYLRQLSLYSYAKKVLQSSEYPGCDFIKD